MKRDSIFFRLFQQSPTLLFELLAEMPESAERYRFDSVAVKEPKFEIDGVFLPPDDTLGVVYYVEFQAQQDDKLYERMASESSNHFYRNREKFSDWQGVAIYTSRNVEQKEVYPFRMMLNSDQFHRVYLDEIGDARDLPLGLALMALTVEKRKKAPDTARYLAGRVQKELSDPQENRAIMELLTTILIYTFNNLNRAEVEKMLAAEVMLQDTRFYQEVKAEGEVIGEKRGLKEGKLEGKLEERRSIVLLLLKRKTGKLSARTKKKIAALDLPKLEALTIAILDLETVAEVETWLNQH